MDIPDVFSADTILAHASDNTGLSQWGGDGFRTGLDHLVDAFERDEPRSDACRDHFFRTCVYRATMRLKIVAALEQQPEIGKTQLTRPLFVTGLSRTGTTLLHNLLALDPANRPLLYWEVDSPAPPPTPDTRDSDPRKLELAERIEETFQRNPALATAHFTRADRPEECNSLFSHEFASLSFTSAFYLPSYRDWLFERDMVDAYRFYKKQLQLLHWRFQDKHIVLKSPIHLPFLKPLFEVFPDARLVQTHREPLECIPSLCSLLKIVRGFFGTDVDPRMLGGDVLEVSARMADKATDFRASHDNPSGLDIAYKKLVADPVTTIGEIYAFLGRTVTPEFEGNIEDWLAENRQHKHGKHRYSLEEFGLDRSKVHALFQRYYDNYGSML